MLSTPSVIVVIAALLLFAMLVAIVVIAVRAMHGPSVDVPSCRTCGYAVVGLAGTVCPECGVDLSTGGVIQPGDRRPFGVIARLLLWTCLVGFPLFIGARVVISRAPWVTVFVQSDSFAMPSSGAYRAIQADSPANGMMPESPAGQDLQLTLGTLDGAEHTLHVTADGRTVTFSDAAGQPTVLEGPLTAQTIAKWLSTHGVDVTNPRVVGEIDQMLIDFGRSGKPWVAGAGNETAIPPNTAIIAGAGFSSRAASVSSRTLPNPLVRYYAWAGAFIVWAVGVIAVIAHARRRASTMNA